MTIVITVTTSPRPGQVEVTVRDGDGQLLLRGGDYAGEAWLRLRDIIAAVAKPE